MKAQELYEILLIYWSIGVGVFSSKSKFKYFMNDYIDEF